MIPLARYRFTVRLLQPLRLQEYAGSMLRGVFGHGLRSVNCITRAKHCEGCPLLSSCNYAQIFQPATIPALKASYPDVPPPYIIEAAETVTGQLNEADEFSFNIVLFGESVNQLSNIILAFQRAFYHGLGKERASAELIRVEWQQSPAIWTQVFTSNQPSITAHQPQESIPHIAHGITSLKLKLNTPTRIQQYGKICTARGLNAQNVLGSLQRKVKLYCQLYLADAVQLPPVTTEGIELISHTQTQKWRRYSNRQQQLIELDGQVGEITLNGDLTNWLPWLWLGLWTHIGKNTSFGLGHYQFTD